LSAELADEFGEFAGGGICGRRLKEAVEVEVGEAATSHGGGKPELELFRGEAAVSGLGEFFKDGAMFRIGEVIAAQGGDIKGMLGVARKISGDEYSQDIPLDFVARRI
jgi:hypothetical protein